MADKSEIKAPISGQVIQSSAVVGEMAASGMSLAVIADTDNLYVSANVKEGASGTFALARSSMCRSMPTPAGTFAGGCTCSGRATTSTFSLLPAQNNSGNYTKVTQVIPVKIGLLDTGGAQLMTGMNATVKITSGTSYWSCPRRAITDLVEEESAMINMINWRNRLIAVILIGLFGLGISGCRSRGADRVIRDGGACQKRAGDENSGHFRCPDAEPVVEHLQQGDRPGAGGGGERGRPGQRRAVAGADRHQGVERPTAAGTGGGPGGQGSGRTRPRSGSASARSQPGHGPENVRPDQDAVR